MIDELRSGTLKILTEFPFFTDYIVTHYNINVNTFLTFGRRKSSILFGIPKAVSIKWNLKRTVIASR